MHWSLAELREMDADEYRELIAWAEKRSERNEPDSIDADAIVDARKAKAEAVEPDE